MVNKPPRKRLNLMIVFRPMIRMAYLKLVVDTTKNTQLLGWTAPYNVDTSLEKMFNTAHQN